MAAASGSDLIGRGWLRHLELSTHLRNFDHVGTHIQVVGPAGSDHPGLEAGRVIAYTLN